MRISDWSSDGALPISRWAGRWRTRWHLLRQVVQMRVFLNAGGSCPSRHERRFTDNPPGIAMELPCHASRPAPQGAVGAFSPVVGWLTWPGVSKRTGEAFGRGCRVGPISLRSGSAQGRSEEHTSELQSLMRITYAVLCLNKKKQ